jgi:hypothetical protein
VEEALASAVARTVAAGTARLALETRFDFTRAHPLLRRRGGLVGGALRRTLGPGASVVERPGAIDFAGARCAVAGPRRPSVVVGDSEWSGRPGRPVDRAPPGTAPPATPLWLFDLCRGIVVTAETAETAEPAPAAEAVRAATDGGGRSYAATADLTAVSDAVPYDVAVPYLAGSAEGPAAHPARGRHRRQRPHRPDPHERDAPRRRGRPASPRVRRSAARGVLGTLPGSVGCNG